ncbi:MAG: hypothetical protein PVJ43_12305 [Gemmatimonadales bacterium]|jgi:hypothetical protein
MIGSDSCELGKEWKEEQHVDTLKTSLTEPSICWEYAESTKVFVDFTYAFEPGHPGSGYWWHLVKFYEKDIRCDTALDPDGAVLLWSAYVDDHDNMRRFKDTITLPASPRCAFVTLEAALTEDGSSDDYVYLRIMTELSNIPPESVTAEIEGLSVKLSWLPGVPVPTQVKREDTVLAVVHDSLNTFSDSSFSYDTSYVYWLRHYISTMDVSGKARITDWSDSVLIQIPPQLRAGIQGDSLVNKGDECTWSDASTGGSGLYSYQWSGLFSDTAQMFTTSIDDSGWLYLTVTDENGWYSTDSLYIEVGKGYPECHLR